MNVSVSRDGEFLGEFPEESILQALESGRFKATDHYFTEGMTNWRPLSDFGSTASPPDKGETRPQKRPVRRQKRKREKTRREPRKLFVALVIPLGAIVLSGIVVLAVLFSGADPEEGEPTGATTVDADSLKKPVVNVPFEKAGPPVGLIEKKNGLIFRNGDAAPFTGVFHSEMEEGLIIYQVADGQLDGPRTTFYPSGIMMNQANFKAGTKDGPEFYWSPEGDLTRFETYQNGKLHGLSAYFFPGERPREIHHYDQGRKHGVFIEYHENGNRSHMDEFANGVQEGSAFSFHPDGSLMMECYYSNDSLNGRMETYRPDGSLFQETWFRNGLRHGASKEWDADGNLIRHQEYADDQVVEVHR